MFATSHFIIKQGRNEKNLMIFYYLIILSEAYWDLYQTSKMEFYEKCSITWKTDLVDGRIKDNKVNESRWKWCGVTLHFSTLQILLKKYLEKINIGKSYWKKYRKSKGTWYWKRKDKFWKKLIEISFAIDSLTTNNTI